MPLPPEALPADIAEQNPSGSRLGEWRIVVGRKVGHGFVVCRAERDIPIEQLTGYNLFSNVPAAAALSSFSHRTYFT